MKSVVVKLFSVVLVLAAMLSFAGCESTPPPEEEAKAVFSGLIDSIRKVDMEGAGKYIDTGTLTNVTVDDLEGGDEVIEAVFSRLSAEIVSSTVVNDGEVNITAALTTIDLTGVLGQCTQTVMNEIMTGKLSEDKLETRTEEIFKQEIAKDGLPTVANQVTVKVKNTDDGWKVEMNPEFQNAISGGFLGQVEKARQSMLK